MSLRKCPVCGNYMYGNEGPVCYACQGTEPVIDLDDFVAGENVTDQVVRRNNLRQLTQESQEMGLYDDPIWNVLPPMTQEMNNTLKSLYGEESTGKTMVAPSTDVFTPTITQTPKADA